MGWLGGALGLLGNVVSGFFGLKQAQGQAVQGAMTVIGDINASEASREAAIASVLAGEASSGYWLTSCWRPLTMLVFVGILVSYWFGYVPPDFNKPMSPMMVEVFGMIKFGLGGYMGARTIEKIMSQINIASILRVWIAKKFA